MDIYLDDCSDEDALIYALAAAGHNVRTPRTDDLRGVGDDIHLAHAATCDLALMTKNPADFVRLHEEYVLLDRHHAGILLVYQDAIRQKNMQVGEVVTAVAHLLVSAAPIKDQIYNLNHWR